MIKVIGFFMITITIIDVFTYDLKAKEKIKLYAVMVFFMLAITIGAGMITGWK